MLLETVDPDGITIRKSKVIRRRVYHTIRPGYINYIDGNTSTT